MKRPLTVTIIACVLLLAGVVGFIYHATNFQTWHPFRYDVLLIELIRVLAVIAGIYLLRGSNWARWLALAWIALHVFISVLNSWSQFAFHLVFLAIFAYVLLRPAATAYFRHKKTAPA